MAPFYGWSSTASRLQPLWGGSLLFTSEFPEIPAILSLTYNKMPPPLLFWSSLWGTEKPFIKDWIDGKVLFKLVSDNIKIRTYCTSEINSISNLLWMEFIFKSPIIEKASNIRKARCPGDEVVHMAIYLDFLSQLIGQVSFDFFFVFLV